MTVADALIDAILMATRFVSLLRMSCWVVDILFSIFSIPRYYSASAACLVDTCSCTVYGTQSPLWTISVGLSGVSIDDQISTYDRSFCMAMSTSNIIQNADMMSDFLCSDSSVADGVIRSSMYAGLCV